MVEQTERSHHRIGRLRPVAGEQCELRDARLTQFLQDAGRLGPHRLAHTHHTDDTSIHSHHERRFASQLALLQQ